MIDVAVGEKSSEPINVVRAQRRSETLGQRRRRWTTLCKRGW